MSSTNALRFASYPTQTRGYASDKGKMELYSDEEGSIGAGIDDVAKSDAAFNSETDPHKAAKQVEQEVSLPSLAARLVRVSELTRCFP